MYFFRIFSFFKITQVIFGTAIRGGGGRTLKNKFIFSLENLSKITRKTWKTQGISKL